MPSTRTLLLAAGSLLLLAVVVVLPLEAQAGGASSQSLRSYRFLFIAYAIAWLLVFGWVVSVARRLSKLDARLRD